MFKRFLKSKKGMTLLELMVALAVFSIAIGTVMGIFAASNRTAATAQAVDKNSEIIRAWLDGVSDVDTVELCSRGDAGPIALLGPDGETVIAELDGFFVVAKNKDGQTIKFMKLSKEEYDKFKEADTP